MEEHRLMNEYEFEVWICGNFIHLFIRLQLEVSHLLEEINKRVDQPIEPTILLIPSMSNIISSLAFGKRFEYDDPDRIMLDNLIMVGTKLLNLFR